MKLLRMGINKVLMLDELSPQTLPGPVSSLGKASIWLNDLQASFLYWCPVIAPGCDFPGLDAAFWLERPCWSQRLQTGHFDLLNSLLHPGSWPKPCSASPKAFIVTPAGGPGTHPWRDWSPLLFLSHCVCAFTAEPCVQQWLQVPWGEVNWRLGYEDF